MTSINPSTNNTRPAQKRTDGMRFSIRTKITVWVGLAIAAISLILVGYSVITLRQMSIDSATKEASTLAQAESDLVQSKLSLPLFTARAAAQFLSTIKDPGNPASMSRDQVNAMLRTLLVNNPSFLGTYTLWEPNEFDGQDSTYVGAVAHDQTGRFIPYWVRGDDGIIHVEALAQYETPGIGDWYLLPRSTKNEVTIAPLIYPVQGKDVVMASFVVPIIQNDKFYGIAGVDAPIGFVQQIVDNVNLYDGTTNAVLFSDTGTLIAVRQQPELTNQPANLIYPDFDKIQPSLDSAFTRLTADGKYLQIFSPIDIGNTGTHWIIGLIIPFEKITAPATAAAVRQVAISTGLFLLALVFLWLLAGQIVRPIQVLTGAAQAVTEGNWNVTADVHSHDEAEVLANTFNLMTSELQSLFGTLEQRVADRTKALSSVADVATAASTVLETNKLLQQVVDLAKERFDFYHAHIYLLNEAGDRLILSSGAGDIGRQMVAEGRSIPLDREQSLVARAARQRKGVTVNNVTTEPGFLPNPLLPNTRSELAVPMMVGEQVIGVFDVQSDVIGRFTDADIAVQTTLASQVASAVQNSRWYAQAEASKKDAQLLVEYAAEGIAILDLETELWSEPNENFARVFGMTRAELAKTGPKIMSPSKQPDGRDSTEKAIEMITTAMEKGSHRFEWVHTTAQGTEFYCEIGLVRMPGDHPRLRQSILDITERKRMQELAAQSARHQEAVNLITQRIQAAATIEEAMQVAARELGHALGNRQTMVALEPSALSRETRVDQATEDQPVEIK